MVGSYLCHLKVLGFSPSLFPKGLNDELEHPPEMDINEWEIIGTGQTRAPLWFFILQMQHKSTSKSNILKK